MSPGELKKKSMSPEGATEFLGIPIERTISAAR
jgi:hypothetical protein